MNQFSRYHFQGQKTDEEILLVLHRHWFDIASRFLLVFIMTVAVIAGWIIFPIFLPDLTEKPNSGVFLFIESFFLMILWAISSLIWIDYYLDVWIVTNRRIVNIEQKGLFSRVVSELELKKIQDITTDVKGIIKTFLNYGDLFIQTAAEKERFLFHNIPDPYEVKDLIMKLQKKVEKEEETEFTEMINEKIHHEENI